MQASEKPAQERTFKCASTRYDEHADGGIVMRGHFGIGAIDQRIVETGLDDHRLGIVRHEKMRRAADRLERCTWASIQSMRVCVQVSLEPSKKRDLEIVHTLTPLSLTIATASRIGSPE